MRALNANGMPDMIDRFHRVEELKTIMGDRDAWLRDLVASEHWLAVVRRKRNAKQRQQQQQFPTASGHPMSPDVGKGEGNGECGSGCGGGGGKGNVWDGKRTGAVPPKRHKIYSCTANTIQSPTHISACTQCLDSGLKQKK